LLAARRCRRRARSLPSSRWSSETRKA
jgi:hypothetical protein